MLITMEKVGFSLFIHWFVKSKYLIIPAMIGGAALLADGVLTPAVTVTTAIEGLRGFQHFERFGNDQTIIVVITLTIILILFCSTIWNRIGRETFGPIMFLWFTF